MQIKRNLRSNFENWIETIDMPNILSVDIKYSSLDNFEKSLEWILPSHRQEYFQEKKRFLVNDIIKYIIPPSGKDFKNIDEATTKYMNKIIDELNYIIKSDIKQSKRIIWACQLLHQETKNYRDMSKVIQETTFKDIYLKALLQIILSNRVELLENMATEFVNRAVPLIYETVQNNKVKTTRIFENGSITESVKLCEIYESKKTEIMELISYVKECNVSTNFLDSQLQFYNYGMTLLNKRINDLQKTKQDANTSMILIIKTR